MCGRYFLIVDIEELIERFELNQEPDLNFSQRSQIFPTEKAAVIINSKTRQLKLFKWGLNEKFTSRPIINTRAENIDNKAYSSNSFLEKRCLIPANGFFEWKKKGNKKIKYRIYHRDQKIISLAGIYKDFTDQEGNNYQAFSIITTIPNRKIKEIHNRMPVILSKEDEKLWLNNTLDITVLKELLKPFPAHLTIATPDDDNKQMKLF